MKIMKRLRRRLKKLLAKILISVITSTRFYDSNFNLVKKLLVKMLVRVATDEELIGVVTLEDIYGSNLKKLYPVPSETVSTSEVKQMHFMPWFEKRLQHLKEETYTTPEIFTTVLDGVLYCPENYVILTKSREVISESLVPDCMPSMRSFFNWGKIYQPEIEKISGYCSIFRAISNDYFHKLADNIPRVYLLNQPEYIDIDEIKLLCPEPIDEVESFLIPKIAPPNVKITSVPTDHLYYIEKLIFPSFLSRWGAPYLPTPYLEKLRTDVLPQRPRRKEKRIYISREKCASAPVRKRHILNEEELFKALSKVGFERYVLEDISISDKIELFYDAEIVIGPHGAGMSHTMFSEQINVIDLFPNNLTSPYICYLGKSLGHRYHFLCANASHSSGNFSVDVPEVLELLSKLELIGNKALY